MPDNPQSMTSKPAVPAGRRVYAIGDVHGRLDLLHGAEARFDNRTPPLAFRQGAAGFEPLESLLAASRESGDRSACGSGFRTAIERWKARKAGERHVENVQND